MELYDTEEQQVEAIKDWWKENGKAVIIGAVVGLGSIFGWRYYQHSTLTAQEITSESYRQVMANLTAQGLNAESDLLHFVEQYPKSQYAVLAAMQLAKVQAEAGQLDEAIAQLKWAQGATKDAALSPILTLNIARLQAEQNNFDMALAELTTITDANWLARAAELRGDIALRQGDKDAAYAAYSEAQQASNASQTLQLKLDDLAR